MAPNILLIITHDTGRHLGCYGVDTVRTPNLDALAQRGVRFTRHFANSALCSPSRGSLLTGRYPQTNGMMGLCHPPFHWNLKPTEKHLSRLLHERGYETALIGHQHEAWHWPTDPDFSPAAGSPMCFDHQSCYRAEHGRHTYGREVADEVERFLGARAGGSDKPFYLQVGLFETHRSFAHGDVPPDEARGITIPSQLADTPAARAELAQFQGAVREMDTVVGRMLSAVEQAGLGEETIIVWTTDHGIDFPRAKRTLYDAGIGVGFLMHWPGGHVAGGRTVEGFTSHVDVTPTLLELADQPPAEGIEGVSFAAAARGTAPAEREEVFAMQQAHQTNSEYRCIRTDRYKLIRNFEMGRELKLPIDIDVEKHSAERPTVELYDLQNDPDEFENLAGRADIAQVQADLDGRLWRWLESVADPILAGPIATPTYQAAIADYHAWRG